MTKLNSRHKISIFLGGDENLVKRFMQSLIEGNILHICVDIETENYAGKITQSITKEFVSHEEFLKIKKEE